MSIYILGVDRSIGVVISDRIPKDSRFRVEEDNIVFAEYERGSPSQGRDGMLRLGLERYGDVRWFLVLRIDF